jgi:pimeloyl-ACP methyl ester carboxylesterase
MTAHEIARDSAPTASTVVSADGSTIALHRTGSGPVVVLVDPAMATHKDSSKLAAVLAGRFTAVSFDRRGRGGSTDASPESADPQREIEDIEAVIGASGGSAVLVGSSSGAALVLEAATRLGDRVTGVLLYEPPYIVDGSRPPVAADLPARIAADVARGDRSAAASAFFKEAVGIPGWMLGIMRILPMWRSAKAIAPTVRYDFAVLDGTQRGEPLPAGRWAAMQAPGIVMVGSKSELFFHTAAQALAEAVPSLRYEALEGGHHGSPQMAPAGIARRITEVFGS